MAFPRDFPVPVDQGGPGQGQPVGGFGGNPSLDRSGHGAVVARTGKAPVILVHGNAGAADRTTWDMLDLKRMLNRAGYPDEIIWAPSYLGPGVLDNESPFPKPHTNNVNEVREFIDDVCAYLNVDVVDVIAHSLGCSLVYAICRGLEKRVPPPVNFTEPKRWNRLGTFVALAGAFHGLRPPSGGEWVPGGEFVTGLLEETLGGGGETPYRAGQPQTPPPAPHNITYFCGIAKGDFVDASLPGTGKLAGAVNREYDRGPSVVGHERIKEDPVVFADFLPLLNSVPPAPPVTITLSPPSGGHAAPLTLTLSVTPANVPVDVRASRVAKAVVNGHLSVTELESLQQTLGDGETLKLPNDGMWELTLSAPGAVDDLTVAYWVGVPELTATITTDDATPFTTSLAVTATTSNPRARLYYSLGENLWNEAANVTITENAVVSFIAIGPSGNASMLTSKAFTKRVVWTEQVTANVNQHFIARRITVTEFPAYLSRFGLTPFTLYLVDGHWVLDPTQPGLPVAQEPGAPTPPGILVAARDDSGPAIRIRQADPQPGQSQGAVTVTVEAVDAHARPVTAFYTQDGALPDEGSPSFHGQKRFDFTDSGNHVVTCYSVDNNNVERYAAFPYTVG